MSKNSATFLIRLPPAELHEWRLQAAFHGITISEWIREKCRILKEEEPIDVQPTKAVVDSTQDDSQTQAVAVVSSAAIPASKVKTCRHGHRAGFKCSQCKGGVASA